MIVYHIVMNSSKTINESADADKKTACEAKSNNCHWGKEAATGKDKCLWTDKKNGSWEELRGLLGITEPGQDPHGVMDNSVLVARVGFLRF